jgi:hypothetical protein
MKIRIFIILFIFFFCLLGFILTTLFPSPPDELNELSETHYIEVKIWVNHQECIWVSDLIINDKQKIAAIISMLQGYADDDWMRYIPSASGNLFVNFYNENENRIFSLIVSSIFKEKQSYFLTQTNGPSISITESEFKDLMGLLDVDEDCAIVKSR